MYINSCNSHNSRIKQGKKRLSNLLKVTKEIWKSQGKPENLNNKNSGMY